ncbi:unnamed protein product [Phaeothamnion confervicola]
MIDTSKVPAGTVAVPVTVYDNGVEYATTLAAGHAGANIVGGTGLAPALSWTLSLKEPISGNGTLFTRHLQDRSNSLSYCE